MSRPTIFWVDDDPDSRELARLAFERTHLAAELEIAGSVIEAIEYLLDENRAVPALVLLDFQLAGTRSLEILRRLRQSDRTKYVPVVILSASREVQDLTDSYDLGCNSYICKPIDFLEFERTLRQIGHYWLDLNEIPSEL